MRATFRFVLFVPAAICLLALAATARPETPPAARTSLVELDVVVLDRNEHPVRGLQQSDFEIKEDGKRVNLTSFSEASLAGLTGPADGRIVSLLLDDNSVPLNGTTIMQALANLFVSFARPTDEISVIRLTHAEDKATAGIPAALELIGQYHTGSLSFLGRDMREDTLLTVARVARELEPIGHRRKTLVCIGTRDVCDPFFEVPENSLLYKSWRDAISATARANADVYVVAPSGVIGRVDLGGGLADTTGGGVFVRSNDFERSARLIWEEAGHYYLLGYTPTAKRRDLHRIDVSVRRSGLHVHARQARGD